MVVLEDDYEPLTEVFYFRQGALSVYNGHRLVPLPEGEGDLLLAFPTTDLEIPVQPSGFGRRRVQSIVSLLVPHDEPFGLDAPVRFTPRKNPDPSRFVRSYLVESLAWTGVPEPLLSMEAGSSRWSEAEWDLYTQAPADPRYLALAEEMVTRVPDGHREQALPQALAMKLWLDEHMRYTRSERHEGVEDPTADFLFGNLTGYCVHAAHSLVYLMRSRGLPARVATGYAVEASQRRGSSILIRDFQAHAWAELYLEEAGWVPIDVSPAENLDPPAPPMDDDLAKLLGELSRQQPPEDESEPPQTLNLAALLNKIRDALPRLLAHSVAYVLVAHYLVKLWRRWRVSWALQRKLARVSYRAALDLLAEVDLVREPGESRERFAERVAPVAPSFTTLTQLHLAGTLGDPARAPKRAEHRAALRAVRRELGASIGFLRRLTGGLNPFSFYRSS